MTRRKRQHWMDEISQSLRQRMEEAIPSVSEGVMGDAPLGYKPPNADNEVKTFLNMPPEQRQQLFQAMGPETYRDWSTSMMSKLTTRFGPAAQILYPMLQGAPIEALANGVSLGDDPSAGIAAAEAELTDLLGFDPFS